MRKGILLLLFGIPTLGFGQQKHEFGLTVKYGNYALPKDRLNSGINLGFAPYEQTVQPITGDNLNFGVWYSVYLGKRFRFSSEMLYRAASFGSKQSFSADFFNDTGTLHLKSIVIQEFTESSLSLPFKFHIVLDKAQRVSVSMGAGLTHLFSSRVISDISSQFGNNPVVTSADGGALNRWDDFNSRLSLNAGVQVRLNQATTLGIEYVFEKYEERFYPSLPRFVVMAPLQNCFCLSDGSAVQPNMNSFSVALRHNLLHNEVNSKN